MYAQPLHGTLLGLRFSLAWLQYDFRVRDSLDPKHPKPSKWPNRKRCALVYPSRRGKAKQIFVITIRLELKTGRSTDSPLCTGHSGGCDSSRDRSEETAPSEEPRGFRRRSNGPPSVHECELRKLTAEFLLRRAMQHGTAKQICTVPPATEPKKVSAMHDTVKREAPFAHKSGSDAALGVRN